MHDTVSHLSGLLLRYCTTFVQLFDDLKTHLRFTDSPRDKATNQRITRHHNIYVIQIFEQANQRLINSSTP